MELVAMFHFPTTMTFVAVPAKNKGFDVIVTFLFSVLIAFVNDIRIGDFMDIERGGFYIPASYWQY
jgi:hypothetical protein